MMLSSAQKHYLDFLFTMTEKEIKARYKFALLGFLWVFLNPLLQMLVMGFIFQFFVPVKVDNYFLFLFVGLLPWNFFSLTVSKNAPAIVNERALIQKAKFPREVIILSIVLSNLFHFLIAFSLLLVALIADKFLQGYSPIELFYYIGRVLLSLPLCIWLACVTSGFSLLFSALNVRFRDINFIVQAFMSLWFYATPIVYTLGLLPLRFQFLFLFNPLTGIVQLFQYILLNQPTVPLTYLIVNLLFGAFVVLIGWKVFHKESPFFDDWV
jgi:lipopolysaccharide transport system permease protein